MPLSLVVLASLGLGALAVAFSKSWNSAILLMLIEISWVCVCVCYGSTFFQANEVYLLFWACAMLFFSAVELVLSSVMFIAFAETRGSETAPKFF